MKLDRLTKKISQNEYAEGADRQSAVILQIGHRVYFKKNKNKCSFETCSELVENLIGFIDFSKLDFKFPTIIRGIPTSVFEYKWTIQATSCGFSFSQFMH
jgi:hypothetical protein